MLREFQKEIEVLRKKLAEDSASEGSSGEEVIEDGKRVKRKRPKCKLNFIVLHVNVCHSSWVLVSEITGFGKGKN